MLTEGAEVNQRTVAAALEAEHHEIDRGLAEFEQHLAAGGWDVEPLSGAASALRRHIYIEEEFLFPTLSDLGLIAPVTVMLREHGEIWRALDAVECAARDETDRGRAQRLYIELADLLAAHNDKEEVILYPAADTVLKGAEVGRLHQLIADGALPPGWVCKHAGEPSLGSPPMHNSPSAAGPHSSHSGGEGGRGASKWNV